MISPLSINVTACSVGGAVQVAVGFIRYACHCPEREGRPLLILSCEAVAAECLDCQNLPGIEWVIFENGPASVRHGGAVRRAMVEAVRKSGAAAVFTVFGPSYVKFPVPELSGFAVGFVMAPTPDCYANHPFWEAWKSRVVNRLKLWALRPVREFWVETETARAGLARHLSISPNRVHVVLNGVNASIAQADTREFTPIPGRILMLGAGYWHKNHAIIPATAVALQKLLPDSPWHFAVTLPSDSPMWADLQAKVARLGMGDRLVNLGKLRIAECARAYAECQVVLHPSLLETFSATYVESMLLRRPLVVSDRGFAREICGEAALYCEPRDPNAVAHALASVLTDSALSARLVRSGEIQVQKFPDASAKNGKLWALAMEFLRRASAVGKSPR